MKKQVAKFINERGFDVSYSGKDKTMYVNVLAKRRGKTLFDLSILGITEYCEQVIEETKKEFPYLSFKLTY